MTDDFPLDTDFHTADGELKLQHQYLYDGNVAVLRNGHYCTQCRERIREDSIHGPVNIVTRTPDEPDGITREFCDWECAADWFQVQAGREPLRLERK